VNRRPRLYFSLRSPFSWMTVERLRREIPDLFDRFDLRPYWDPDQQTSAALTERGGEYHYVQMSKAKHLYILQDTKRMAARLGLTMAWPIDVDPWWELPHLGWLAAGDRAEPFYDALVDARWRRGEDICTPEVVSAAAIRSGLDPDAVLGAPQDPAVRARGVDCLLAAYDDDVFGVPYLRLGLHRFWGLDRVDAFLEAYRAREPVPAAAYDTDTAGGCG
jgi:2-hydroxychromene-2-carboxylate isomerase